MKLLITIAILFTSHISFAQDNATTIADKISRMIAANHWNLYVPVLNGASSEEVDVDTFCADYDVASECSVTDEVNALCKITCMPTLPEEPLDAPERIVSELQISFKMAGSVIENLNIITLKNFNYEAALEVIKAYQE